MANKAYIIIMIRIEKQYTKQKSLKKIPTYLTLFFSANLTANTHI